MSVDLGAIAMVSQSDPWSHANKSVGAARDYACHGTLSIRGISPTYRTLTYLPATYLGICTY